MTDATQLSGVRLATWNVNSLKVRLPHVLQWLAEQADAGTPIDFLCLQELKLTDENYPAEPLAEAGYASIFTGQKTYNGVAILARQAVIAHTDAVIKNIPGFADPQQRVIAASYTLNSGEVLRIISAYFPNGQAPDSEKFVYKLNWLNALEAWLKTELTSHPNLALLGDYNIAPEDRDVHDPSQWIGQNLVSPEERAAFARLESLGLTDAFRHFEQAEKSFSWWDYRMMAFRRNAGMRIDHILLSEPLTARCKACVIDKTPRRWEQPSDHTPVVALLQD